MSKESFCKSCRRGRCNMCKGYRNGNKALRCFCRHAKEKPAPTPQKDRPSLTMFSPAELLMGDVAKFLMMKDLPPEVSYSSREEG